MFYFKNGRVHFRNSGIKGLRGHLMKAHLFLALSTRSIFSWRWYLCGMIWLSTKHSGPHHQHINRTIQIIIFKTCFSFVHCFLIIFMVKTKKLHHFTHQSNFHASIRFLNRIPNKMSFFPSCCCLLFFCQKHIEIILISPWIHML